jgi:SAM-dependent methyltransferase
MPHPRGSIVAVIDPADLLSVTDYWDAASASYDEDPDHGLHDPEVREAWRARLAAWLPEPPADVLDLGCGTGSVSLLVAELGHRVHGIDLAGRMVDQARAKAEEQGRSATFAVGDAGSPDVAPRSVDVVTARHLLWTLPDPAAALARWVGAVRPRGRLVLVEGRWTVPGGDAGSYATGADEMPWHGGVRAEDLVAALDPLVDRLEVHCLSGDAVLWGREVDDERYAVVAQVGPAH